MAQVMGYAGRGRPSSIGQVIAGERGVGGGEGTCDEQLGTKGYRPVAPPNRNVPGNIGSP